MLSKPTRLKIAQRKLRTAAYVLWANTGFTDEQFQQADRRLRRAAREYSRTVDIDNAEKPYRAAKA